MVMRRDPSPASRLLKCRTAACLSRWERRKSRCCTRNRALRPSPTGLALAHISTCGVQFACKGRIVCDSLSVVFDSRELGDGGDDGERPGVLRRSAPAKKGRAVLERMRLRTAACLRQLSDTRAEAVGFARFFHNPHVSVEEILATAGARTAQAAAGRDALLI